MTGQRIGYIRVSSVGQNAERQLEGLQPDRTFEDKVSGKDTNRPKLQEMIEFVRDGDTVVVHFSGDDKPMPKLLLSVMGAFAEFERSIIRERQLEGIALAKQKGVYKGRKKSLTDDDVATIHERTSAGEHKTRIARDFGISRKTLYGYLGVRQVSSQTNSKDGSYE